MSLNIFGINLKSIILSIESDKKSLQSLSFPFHDLKLKYERYLNLLLVFRPMLLLLINMETN